jgi:uncharacterized FlaG/YvyC family protein
MKKSCIFLLTLFFSSALLVSEDIPFEACFTDHTMRIDFFQTGDSDETYVSIDQIYKYPKWAGNPKKTIDTMNSGMYYVKIVDKATNRLLYSKGFATLFGEYKTTDDAKNNIKKTYLQTALIPYPKYPFMFIIEARDKNNLLYPQFVINIDPRDENIIHEESNTDDRIYKAIENGDPHDKVDIVFIAEGYKAEDWEKFKKDVDRFTKAIFRAEPFQSHKEKFNVSGVFRASQHRGTDEPTKGIFKNTVLDSSYNALNTPRYLLIDDTKTLRDIASRVPYDTLIVMANTPRYGGGGIYNDYTIFTSDDERSEQTLMHEFGHGFADLADEYFTSSVAYNEFYPPGVEPYEPNITALLNPEHIKWKHLLAPGIPIPTPWGQEEVEILEKKKKEAANKAKQLISSLEHDQASEVDIRKVQEDLNSTLEQINMEIKKVLLKYQEKYKGKIGVFEGAGYSPKGLFRSEVHVGMFSNGEYGPVSEEAILRIIYHLSH